MNQEAAGNEEPKVWLGEDGIVRIKTVKKMDDENDFLVLCEKYREIVKKLPDKPKVLIDISLSSPTLSLSGRKRIVGNMEDIYKNPGFKKLAIWGGSAIIKVITLFALRVAKIERTKYFQTEADALQWLKEE